MKLNLLSNEFKNDVFRDFRRKLNFYGNDDHVPTQAQNYKTKGFEASNDYELNTTVDWNNFI